MKRYYYYLGVFLLLCLLQSITQVKSQDLIGHRVENNSNTITYNYSLNTPTEPQSITINGLRKSPFAKSEKEDRDRGVYDYLSYQGAGTIPKSSGRANTSFMKGRDGKIHFTQLLYEKISSPSFKMNHWIMQSNRTYEIEISHPKSYAEEYLDSFDRNVARYKDARSEEYFNNVRERLVEDYLQVGKLDAPQIQSVFFVGEQNRFDERVGYGGYSISDDKTSSAYFQRFGDGRFGRFGRLHPNRPNSDKNQIRFTLPTPDFGIKRVWLVVAIGQPNNQIFQGRDETKYFNPFSPNGQINTHETNYFEKLLNDDDEFQRISFIAIPICIEGKIRNSPNEIPILGRTEGPSTPQIVLHDPPGSQSFSSITKGTKVCNTVTLSNGSSSGLKSAFEVKVGSKGSVGAGFIVEAKTDYEIYASVNSSSSVTHTTTSIGDFESCQEFRETYSTRSDPNIEAPQSDLFIGTKSNYFYGVGDAIFYDPEEFKPIVGKRLILAENTGDPGTHFAYTESQLLSQIGNWNTEKNLLEPTDPQWAFLNNQIAIWENVINENNRKKQELHHDMHDSEDGSQGTSMRQVSTAEQSFSSTKTLTNTRSYETVLVVDVSVGTAFGVNVGGSGVSGSMAVSFGANNSNSRSLGNTRDETVTYTLQDDDPEDVLHVCVGIDEEYGTPLFHLDQLKSKTSSPYEGGYRLDQPVISPNECTGNEITVNNTPYSNFDLEIKLENNSREERTYTLSLDRSTNLGSLGIHFGGDNDESVEYTIPGNNSTIVSLSIDGEGMGKRKGNQAFECSDIILRLSGKNDPSRSDELTLNVNFNPKSNASDREITCSQE